MTEIDSTVWAQAQQDYAASGLTPAWEELRFAQQMAFVQRAEHGAPVPATSDVGIFFDVPAEDYHRKELGVANNGALSRVAKSGAHLLAWYNDTAKSAETPAMVLGSAFHDAVLLPARFEKLWSIEPEWQNESARSKAGKAERAEWAVANPGVRILSADDMATVLAMRDSLQAHPVIGHSLVGGFAEVTLRWLDPDTGLKCKARADYYRRDLKLAFDLKTTFDASLDTFPKSCANFNYHVQDAHYSAGFEALGEPLDGFVFVAIEKEPPYAISVTMFGDATKEFARRVWRERMGALNQCVTTKKWPGYSQEIEVIELPTWAMKESA